MGRLILLAVAVAVLVWLVRRALRGPRDGRAAPPGAGDGVLVTCAHCGVHLPRGEARGADGQFYCGEEHARLGPRRP
jgi:uncharacterized protein